MVQFFGALAALVSLISIVIGLPAQIYKNFCRKNCEGLSLSLPLTGFFAFSIWWLYGCLKPDYFLIASQFPGAVLMSVILFQFFIYRKGKQHVEK